MNSQTNTKKFEILRLGIDDIEPWGEELRKFERQFWYPLGPNRKFRIEHPGNYATFFESMGQASCFIAVDNGAVVGVLSVVLRELLSPFCKASHIAYFADIKVAKQKRGSKVLYRMLQSAIEWIGDKVPCAYSVVMDGTDVPPIRYTGRLGIPIFEWVGRIGLLNLPVTKNPRKPRREMTIDIELGKVELYHLEAGIWKSSKVDSRSAGLAVRIEDPKSYTSVVLEDTRLAKRLYDENGQEILFGHLSYPYYEDLRDLVQVLRGAMIEAHTYGYTDVLFPVPYTKVRTIAQRLSPMVSATFSASIYGIGIDFDITPLIYSSEI